MNIYEFFAEKVGPLIANVLENEGAQALKAQSKKLGIKAAEQINKPINVIEDVSMKTVRNRYLFSKMLDRTFMAAKAEGRLPPGGIPGMFSNPIQDALNRPKPLHAYVKLVETMFVPQSGKQAFLGGAIRGSFGEATSSIVGNRTINFIYGKLGKGAFQAPAARNFVRTVRALRGETNISGPVEFVKEVRKGYKASSSYLTIHNKYYTPEMKAVFSLTDKSFNFESRTGYVAGRVGTAAALRFVFVDKKTRNKNVKTFKRKAKNIRKNPKHFIKELHKTTVTVQAYRRKDGTYVHAYTRTG